MVRNGRPTKHKGVREQFANGHNGRRVRGFDAEMWPRDARCPNGEDEDKTLHCSRYGHLERRCTLYLYKG